jgi:hypothetical protein
MDLELKGPTREDMAEVVDYLTISIRETRRIRRVVGREAREKLLTRKPLIQPGGNYEQDQLSLAAQLGVQAAVLGQFSWNGQQYRLKLRLYGVAGGELLWQNEGTFSTKDGLHEACDRLTAGIAGAAEWLPAPKEASRKERSPLQAALGFGLGQQGVSASSAVAGGSYLYLEGLALLNRFVGINARYAFRLFPTAGGSHLLSTHLRFQVPPGKEVFLAGELGYLLSLDPQGMPSNLVGVRLTPIAGGEDEFFFELLPVALYLDVDDWKPVFTLELLSIKVLFGKR